MKEQFELESLLPEEKNALREFIQGQNLFVKLPTVFSESFNRCRCTAAYSAIFPTLASVKTN